MNIFYSSFNALELKVLDPRYNDPIFLISLKTIEKIKKLFYSLRKALDKSNGAKRFPHLLYFMK